MNMNFIINRITKLDQLFYPVTKFLGESQELPVTKGNKTTVRLANFFQQCLQVNNIILVNLQPSGQGKPVLLAGTDVEIKLIHSNLSSHSKFLTFGPLKHHPFANFFQLK